MSNVIFEGSVSLELELLYISGWLSTLTEQELNKLLKEHFLACTPVIIRENELATALRALGVIPEKLRAIMQQGRDASCKVTAAIVQGQDAVLESQKELRVVGQPGQPKVDNVSTMMNVAAAIDRLACKQEEREWTLKRLAGIEQEKRTLARDERDLKERLAMLVSAIAQHDEDETLEAFRRLESEAKLFEFE